jgi:hypothetical protein
MGDLLIAFAFFFMGAIAGSACVFMFGTHLLAKTTKKIFAAKLEAIGYALNDRGELVSIDKGKAEAA